MHCMLDPAVLAGGEWLPVRSCSLKVILCMTSQLILGELVHFVIPRYDVTG